MYRISFGILVLFAANVSFFTNHADGSNGYAFGHVSAITQRIPASKNSFYKGIVDRKLQPYIVHNATEEHLDIHIRNPIIDP